jgi:putative hydrolase of the HAD superfamily
MKHEHIPRVISFDAGFTLIYPYPKVGDAYSDIASRYGYHLDGDEIHHRFLSSWKRHTAANRANEAANALASEERAYAWWKEVFLESMGDLVKEEDINTVFDACHQEYALGKYWRIYADVLPTLQTLIGRGIELVVLSNWDRRLHQTLVDLHLAKYFSHIYISTEIGFAKPQAGAFRHILEELHLPARDVLHIGDSLQDDCQGARNAGLETIHLDREKLQTGSNNDIPIIHSLTELVNGLPQ